MADEPIPPLKACTKCGQQKPASTSHFNKSKLGKYGLASRCRDCSQQVQRENAEYFRQRNQENYRKNKARIRKRAVDRLSDPAEHERQKQRQRDWYVANKDRHIARGSVWSKQNKDARTASRQRSRLNDPERIRGHWRKRNELFLAAGELTAETIQTQMSAQAGRCFYCQVDVQRTYDVDHFIPLARGGTNHPSNIRISCPSCNRSKGAKLPWEWRPSQFKENPFGERT